MACGTLFVAAINPRSVMEDVGYDLLSCHNHVRATDHSRGTRAKNQLAAESSLRPDKPTDVTFWDVMASPSLAPASLERLGEAAL